jgi:hypothetical protein
MDTQKKDFFFLVIKDSYPAKMRSVAAVFPRTKRAKEPLTLLLQEKKIQSDLMRHLHTRRHISIVKERKGIQPQTL